MKTIKIYLLAFVTMWFIIGCSCGGSSSSTTTTTTPTNEVNLKVGESVVVYEGDVVTPENSDTNIQVIHTLGDDNTKEVILLSGNAKLLRGEFYLNNIAKN